MIQAGSQELITEIREKWKRGIEEVFKRDGTSTNPKHECGGQDFKHNPELRQTIGRVIDPYFSLCARKSALYDQRYALEGNKDEAARAELAKIYAEIEEINCAFVKLNFATRELFFAEGTGFEQEYQRYLQPPARPHPNKRN